MGQLHLVGAPAGSEESAFRSALGESGLVVILHPDGGRGLLTALRASGRRVAEGHPATTVAVQLRSSSSVSPSSRAFGAGAFALQWADGPGLEPVEVDSAPLAEPPAAVTGPPRIEVSVRGIADRLHEAGSTAHSSTGSPVEVGAPPDSSRWRVTGRVHWIGAWTGQQASLPLASQAATAPPAPLAVVSEGAYVPRPRYLENLPSRWRLAADECGDCGKVTFPQRGHCRHCRSTRALHEILLPREGRIEATTTVGVGAQPTEFDHQVSVAGPYAVVIVQLARGTRGTFQVTDAPAGSLPIGAVVRLKLRRLYPMEGEWRYGLKAAPLAPSSPR